MMAAVAVSGISTAFPAQAEEVTKVKMAGSRLLTYAPMWIAKELGYFTDERLDVDILETQGGNATTSALLGGSVDAVAASFISPSLLAEQGKRIQSMVGMDMSNIYVFVTDPKLGVVNDDPKSLVDALKGKRFGVASLGSPGERQALNIFNKYGAKDGDIMLVAVGTGATAFAALRAGGIAGMITYEPDLTQALKTGAVEIALDLRNTKSEKVYSKMASSTLQSTPQWIEKNPEAAKGIVKAIVRANNVLLNDPDTALKALKVVFHSLPEEDVKSMYDGERKSFRSSITPEDLELVQKITIEGGTLTKASAYKDVVADQFSILWQGE